MRAVHRRSIGRLTAGLGALALVATGCGGNGNDQHPATPTATTVIVTVTPSDTSVSASPTRTAYVAAPGSVQGFASPSGVVVIDDQWFVSNLGDKKDPAAKDGTGFVSQLTDHGTVTNRTALPRPGEPKLNAPAGMAVVNGTLYVADVDRVVGYDPHTLTQIFEATLTADGPILLDSIAALDDTTLLVTDTAHGAVHQLHTADKRFEPLATQIPGAKGIAVDRDRKLAYVAAAGDRAEGGDLYRLELRPGTVTATKLGAVHGVLAGVQVLPNGNIAVADWVTATAATTGTIKIYRPDGTEVSKVSLPSNLHGPTGFSLDAANKNLLVAARPDNALAIVPIN
ncbi:hypothetical protein ACWDSJ_03055 [Nocardia sp. NPDC003482]